MVSVFFGSDTNAVVYPDTYFNNYEVDWLEDEFVKSMIKDIDGSEVVSKYCINSPVFGQIPPSMLSGGVKGCILLYKEEGFLLDLIACGDNCESWLSEIFKRKDVSVVMSGYDLSFSNLPIEGICENDGSKIHDYNDWLTKMWKWVGVGER